MSRQTVALVFFFILSFVLALAAQQPAAAVDGPQSGGPAKEKSHQKEDRAGAQEVAGFDERDAAAVLGIIRNGLEGHSQRLLLSAFDGSKMDGYLTFEDQIEAYFTRYEAFRVTLRIIQTSEENQRGVILAEFQLEDDPRGGGRITRRQGQLRFELERGAKGWKIVDFNPRGFFS